LTVTVTICQNTVLTDSIKLSYTMLLQLILYVNTHYNNIFYTHIDSK